MSMDQEEFIEALDLFFHQKKTDESLGMHLSMIAYELHRIANYLEGNVEEDNDADS